MHVEKRLRNEYSISLSENDPKSIDQANHLRKLAAKNILRSIFINQSIVYVRLNQTWFLCSRDRSRVDAN